jgi:hypothetical protein
MDWQGFFRFLQPDIMSVIAFGVILTAILILVWLLAGEGEGGYRVRRNSVLGYVSVMFIAFVILLWRFEQVALTDRMPRKDADRSGVYRQMEQLQQDAAARKP